MPVRLSALREPIRVETPHGTVQLRPYLTVGHAKRLDKLRPETDGREFTVQAIWCVMTSPQMTAEAVRAWDDETLVSVAMAWANDRRVGWHVTAGARALDAFTDAFAAHLRETNQQMMRAMKPLLGELDVPTTPPILAEALQGSAGFSQALMSIVPNAMADANRIVENTVLDAAGSITRALQGSLGDATAMMSKVAWPEMSTISDTLVKPLLGDLQKLIRGAGMRLFDALPDLHQLGRDLEERAQRDVQAAEALGETGYGFLVDYWYSDDLAVAAGMERVPPRVRPAAMTNRLRAYTRSAEFSDMLLEDLRNSSVQRRRQHLLEEALVAHRECRYGLSIPVLYAQVEGMFMDALVLKGAVVRQSGKLYAKENGQLKLQKTGKNKGKPIELQGLVYALKNKLADLNKPLFSNPWLAHS